MNSAGQIQLLGDELKEASQMLVSRLLSDWNSVHDGIGCLPDEILALCFTFLPFRGRVFASHVSRRWRSISLNNPEIWAYIGSDLPSRHRPELFAMALERTGSHPVDVFECPDQHDGVEGLLVDHMHHIRSLYYPRVLHSAPLSFPAPYLETFVCNARAPLTIAANFLGGTVGRLRKLRACSANGRAWLCPSQERGSGRGAAEQAAAEAATRSADTENRRRCPKNTALATESEKRLKAVSRMPLPLPLATDRPFTTNKGTNFTCVSFENDTKMVAIEVAT